MLAFKTLSAVRQFPDCHPRLVEIVEDLLEVWPDSYMEVTRIADPSPPEQGVHLKGPPHRALDIRTNDLTVAAGAAMEQYVNARWRYGDPTDASRPVAKQHGAGDGRHLHLQTRDETERRV